MTDTAPPTDNPSGKTSSFGFRDVDAKEKVRMVRGVFDSVADEAVKDRLEAAAIAKLEAMV